MIWARRFLCLIVMAIGPWYCLARAQEAYYETKISTNGITALSFDDEKNPYALLRPSWWTHNIGKWVNDHWEEEALPLFVQVIHHLNIDSMSSPHIVAGSTHVFKTSGGWQSETLPFAPSVINFKNPSFPIMVGFEESGSVKKLKRGIKNSGAWEINVSSINFPVIDMKSVIKNDGTIYFSFKKDNQLKVYEFDGQSTELVFATPIVGKLLGFEMEPNDQFRVLTSSQNISYPPLTIVDGFELPYGEIRRTLYSSGRWTLLRLGLGGEVPQYLLTLSGSELVAEMLPKGIDSSSFVFTQGIEVELGADARPFISFKTSKNDRSDIHLSLIAKLPVPVQATVSGRTPSSIRWSWPPRTSEVVTGYRLRRAGDNADMSGILAPTVNDWTQEGLGPNSAVSAYLETIYPGFVLPSTPVAAASAGYPPGSFHMERSQASGLSMTWSGESNPAGMSYRVDLHAPDGTVFSQTTQSTAHIFPALPTSVPYALNVTVLSSDGSGVSMSTVDSVTLAGSRLQMGFHVGAVAVEAVLFPVNNYLSPILAAAARSSFPAVGGEGLTPTGRGFQLAMGHDLPEGQQATVSMVYPPGWLDGAPAGPLVLARYDDAHKVWIALPTRQTGRRLTATADGFGVFQVMGRTGQTGALDTMAAYPNPFRLWEGATLVVREVPAGARATVQSLDGKNIRTIEATEAGLSQWDGRDGDGELVKSGVYVIRVERDGVVKKMKVIVER